MGDSMGQMEDFYLGQAATGSMETMAAWRGVDAVTRERMLARRRYRWIRCFSENRSGEEVEAP